MITLDFIFSLLQFPFFILLFPIFISKHFIMMIWGGSLRQLPSAIIKLVSWAFQLLFHCLLLDARTIASVRPIYYSYCVETPYWHVCWLRVSIAVLMSYMDCYWKLKVHNCKRENEFGCITGRAVFSTSIKHIFIDFDLLSKSKWTASCECDASTLYIMWIVAYNYKNENIDTNLWYYTSFQDYCFQSFWCAVDSSRVAMCVPARAEWYRLAIDI